jgi:hypothetical protein
MVDEAEKTKTKDKIMYILLKWVYEKGAGLNNPYYDDLLNVAEIIWHDFEFPESIIHFAAWLRYPTNEPDLGSIEKNTARLLNHWRKYLDEQQVRWKKVT